MAHTKNSIAILILAAGASSRMGQSKQLLPWNNTTLLGNAITNAKMAIGKDVYVVLGANTDNIKKEHQEEGIVFIKNENWQQGLGSSIAAGVLYLLQQNTLYKGILIMLADQPYVDASYLNEMVSLFLRQEKEIVTTKYKNREGVPAIFSSKYYMELSKLHEDYGAKEIIKQYKNDTASLHPNGREIDIDTQEDYKNSIHKSNNK